jgi:plasmid stabilization system protein ParE
MSYQVRILARARQDFEEYVEWISERSQQGAERWVESFEAAI